MYQNDYKITADGFGIHTFELTSTISSSAFRHIPYRAGNKKFYCNDGNSICIHPEKRGIRIWLNNPKEDVYNIKIIVTSRIIIDERADAVSILRPSDDFIALGNRVTDILRECLGEEYHIEGFELSRVDCCVNIMLSENFAAQRYIKLLHKSMKYNSTEQIITFPNDAPNAKEKNKHNFRIKTGDITFTAYDKYFQLEDIGGSFEKESEAFLRLELSINRDEIRRIILSGSEWKYNTTLIKYFTRHSRDFFVDYIGKYFFPGDYCYLEYMEFLVEKSALKDKIKNRMLIFSEIQCEKHSFLSAKNEMMRCLASAYKFKKMLFAFEALNINPISLSYRDKHGANVIPGLYKILGL